MSRHAFTATVLCAVATAVAAPAHAANLGAVLAQARANDAQYAAAVHAATAGREKRVQGRALLLPTVAATGTLRQNNERSSQFAGSESYLSGTAALNVTQPLFRLANVAGAEQGELQARLADQQLQQAEHELLLRVARGYFEVLQAQDALATLGAQKETFATQLAQAKRSLEVGTTTITDVNEAQARHDLTVAQEIAARNDLEVKRRVLEKSLNAPLPPLAALDAAAAIDLIAAPAVGTLLQSAATQALPVLIGLTNEQIARREVDRQRAGHIPTVDLVGSFTKNHNASFGQRNDNLALGLAVEVPLYQGGAITSREREAAANLLRAQAELENARRQATFDARQAALGLENGLALDKALRQAVVSGETQVRSTRRGLEVGVRTRVDVLNAEQQLFTTRRDLSAARYQVLVAGLQLKAAAGTLAEADLKALDALLKD
jgi:outer membrane protein